jgi:hypothetical protein
MLQAASKAWLAICTRMLCACLRVRISGTSGIVIMQCDTTLFAAQGGWIMARLEALVIACALQGAYTRRKGTS